MEFKTINKDTLKKLLKIIPILIWSSCVNERDNELDYHNRVSNFLNEVITIEEINSCFVVVHEFGGFMNPKLSKEYISNELSEYYGTITYDEIKKKISLSKKNRNNLKINSNNIINYNELDSIRNMANNKKSIVLDLLYYKFGCIKGFSIPLFSDDYEYAFIYQYYISGSLIGNGSCRIYKNEKNSWRLVKEFAQWLV